jgi:hypothetical protein
MTHSMVHVPDLLRAYSDIHSMDRNQPVTLYINRSDRPRPLMASSFVLNRPDDSTWRLCVPNTLEIVWSSTEVKSFSFLNSKGKFRSADYSPGSLRVGFVLNG